MSQPTQDKSFVPQSMRFPPLSFCIYTDSSHSRSLSLPPSSSSITRKLQLVAPSSHSVRFFRRGAATRTAANGADADTIHALGRWCSDSFGCYVDKSAAERAAMSRTALYSNTSADLRLDIPARHSSLTFQPGLFSNPTASLGSQSARLAGT